MERRKALKNIGLSLGAITLSSSVVALLQSCAEERTLAWTPQFFTPDEVFITQITLDVMIPATPNIPGATELNLTQFIDGYLYSIATEKEKSAFKVGIEQYLSSTLQESNKKKAADLSETDIDHRLAYYFKAERSEQQKWGREVDVSKKDNAGLPSVDAVNFSVLKSLRTMAIEAFKVCELIGEKILAYDPIPGSHAGCVDLQELTQGKAWSL
ncbi:gluconate 2-dehydrogenase subunit 3 family protein [Pseudozobellia thermophila]|uniref:gluconate 2-dehydrogenase subunit 3 family protein n=1 Tax=Pseudozobellia thermophila TaxID=192903 RepID=UPI0014819A15|nr:gluconate 2-dehydrogenase subunit 3 family protein [Pseudozobellia thermophila]